jgi:hypothetical protein
MALENMLMCLVQPAVTQSLEPNKLCIVELLFYKNHFYIILVRI